MSESFKGLIAMIATCTIWGLSSIFYKSLSHVPPLEVLAHRTIWSLVFFILILSAQRRLPAMIRAMQGRRALAIIAFATLMISANWFMFIWSVQSGHATEAALGYYVFPLLAVLLGRIVFAERLAPLQWLAVALAALGVSLLTYGLGTAPWVALSLAGSFSAYGLMKKQLDVGPVVSVSAEVLLLSPVAALVLWQSHHSGAGHFGASTRDTLMLICAGPLTAVPLILFSYAARRLTMATAGLLSYLNPTLQFFCAVLLFAEPLTGWHMITFALIWCALALYSASAFGQDRARRRAVRAVAASGTGVI
ncbi:EamA family transporter RarD [Sulfitobacter aestuarii]|uniref:EamA family transporter RarD n=1 Tax=Sulfitobacter aestuarii TaxID=2161676 RepID=A0ABW5U0A8_9RHOB